MTKEPGNPFYTLLVPASVLFVMTVLAYALVPWKRQPDWLQQHGWKVLLVEMAGIILLGLLAMGLDRLRSRRPDRDAPGARKETKKDQPAHLT